MKLAALLHTLCFSVAAFAQQGGIEDIDKNFSDAPETAAEAWIYNDLGQGFADAKATGKPLMVVYRCIP